MKRGSTRKGAPFLRALQRSSAAGFSRPQGAGDFAAQNGCFCPCTVQGGESKGPFSFAKENGPFETPRERLLIGSLRLEWFLCLRNGNTCARRCRVCIAIRFAAASIIRCRSAYLVEVRSSHRLPPVRTMRRAKQSRIRHEVCRRANVTRASR